MKQLLFIGVWCTTMSFSVYRTAIFLFFTLKIGSALAFSVYGATSVSKTCWLVFLHHCQMEELHPLDIKVISELSVKIPKVLLLFNVFIVI
ncbi:hypothetical protein NC651_007069 [Populus alba x Populus x berolinensis]|nr:hypothetical protein NC651_007069 [Populus alba x Populus x berolinensis]